MNEFKNEVIINVYVLQQTLLTVQSLPYERLLESVELRAWMGLGE